MTFEKNLPIYVLLRLAPFTSRPFSGFSYAAACIRTIRTTASVFLGDSCLPSWLAWTPVESHCPREDQSDIAWTRGVRGPGVAAPEDRAPSTLEFTEQQHGTTGNSLEKGALGTPPGVPPNQAPRLVVHTLDLRGAGLGSCSSGGHCTHYELTIWTTHDTPDPGSRLCRPQAAVSLPELKPSLRLAALRPRRDTQHSQAWLCICEMRVMIRKK